MGLDRRRPILAAPEIPCTAFADIPRFAAWSPTGLALACGGEPGAGNEAKDFYVSTDGGAGWRLTGRIPFTPGGGLAAGYVWSLAAARATTWALAEARGTIIVTHDGGRTWRPARFVRGYPGVEGWGYVAFTNATHAVAVPWTLNGDVLAFSSDTGNGWRVVSFER